MVASLEDILGNETLRTIFVWQIAAQVLGNLLDPFWTQLRQTVTAAHPEHVLPAPDVADMVIRGWMTHAEATSEAAGSGINAERFAKLVDNTGEPPGLQLLLEAYRRGYLPFTAAQGEPSVTYGIKTSRVRDEWIPLLERLRFTVPSAADVIAARVENQLDETTARTKFAEAGLNPDTDFDWLYNTHGRPPSPDMVARLVHRGLVPKDGAGPGVISYRQSVAESDLKDKWSDVLFEAATYIPPVRTIVTLLHKGAVTKEQGAQLLAENGVRPADAAAYIAEATGDQVVKEKELAKSDVETLYADQAITRDQATQFLGALGYGGEVADFLLTLVDFRREVKFLNATIGRVHSFYTSRKVDRAHAQDALDKLKVPAAQRDHLLSLWDLERTSNTRLLTEAQIVDAWAVNVLTQDQAESELAAIGYTPFDAWVLLSVKNKAPLPNAPARGPAPSGNIT